jgi:hypothetical protein
MSEDSTYQPGWGEKKKHHHHRHSSDTRYTNSWGGWMKMRDKQAYYGLMFVVLAVLGFGAYKLVMMFVNEWRATPHDDPATEMKVDELRIHKVDEQDALLYGDSLAQVYQFDSSTIKKVQIETRSVYRPPRRENEWYITEREWKDIWRNVQRWRQSQRNDEKVKDRQ